MTTPSAQPDLSGSHETRRAEANRLGLLDRRLRELGDEHRYLHDREAAEPISMEEMPLWAELAAARAWYLGFEDLADTHSGKNQRPEQLMAALVRALAHFVGEGTANGQQLRSIASKLVQVVRGMDTRLEPIFSGLTVRRVPELASVNAEKPDKRGGRRRESLEEKEQRLVQTYFLIWLLWGDLARKARITSSTLQDWLSDGFDLLLSDSLAEQVHSELSLRLHKGRED